MRQIPIPFNIELLLLTSKDIQNIPEVEVPDVFIPSTSEFHPSGLFSTDIFGQPGSPERLQMWGHLNLVIPIIHPVVFTTLIALKKIYRDLMAGTVYAVWDEVEGMFVKSNPIDGETGYDFFIKHMDKIKHPQLKGERAEYVNLLNKYNKKNKFDKLMCLPAGYREYVVGADGRPKENEINNFYRKIMSLANIIPARVIDLKSLDSNRYALQLAVVELYMHINGMLKGKKKLIAGGWASRSVMNGTRNVIVAMSGVPERLGDKSIMKMNDIGVGVYQFSKNTLPVFIHSIKNIVTEFMFPDTNGVAVVVDKKTNKRMEIIVDNKTVSGWTSMEGLEDLVNKFSHEDIHNEPVLIDGNPVALLAVSDANEYKIINDIDDIPDNIKMSVSPITYMELFYIACININEDTPGFLSRYPVAAQGGTFPGKVFLQSTVTSKRMVQLDNMFQPSDVVGINFPVRGSPSVNAMTPHYSKLARAGADFDGDQSSLNTLQTNESISEVNNLLNTTSYYITPDGDLVHSAAIPPLEYVVGFMTRGMKS